MDEAKIEKLISLIFHFSSQDEVIKGLALLDKYILDCPDDMLLRLFRAHALLTIGKSEEARAEGEIAREEMPDNFYLHNILGNVYWCLNKNYMAQEAFERAIEIDPTDSKALSDYALFMVMERGVKLAHKAAENAVKNDAKNSDAWLALGIVQHRLHQLSLFESSIRRSLELNSSNSQARILLLKRLQQKGEKKQAMGLGKLMLENPETREAALELFIQARKKERIHHVVENSDYLKKLLDKKASDKKSWWNIF